MGSRATSARELLRRAIGQCAAARWHSLDRLELPGPKRQGSASGPVRQLLGMIQSRARQRLNGAALDAGDAAQLREGRVGMRLQVELAFQHLQLAEQRLLLEEPEAARPHCRRFLQGLLSAACEALGEGLGPEEEQLLQGAAHHLPSRLASQLELRQAVAAGSLPGRMIFVLGMHRSGTSALSGMLCKAGFDAPSDLMPADAVNPRGYWESEGVYQLNDALLEQLGAGWDHPEALPDGWQDSETVGRWRQRLLRHLSLVFREASFPVLKDPRFCVLLPALTPWLESGVIRWNVLLPVRHPLEVARSLEQAQNLPRGESLRLWLHHVFEAERLSRGHPRLLLSFDELIHHPQQSLENCLALLGESCPGEALSEGSRFVTPELHRQRWSDREASEPLVSDPRESLASVTSSLELALRLHGLLQSADLAATATARRLDALEAHWKLLPEPEAAGRSSS